MFERRHQRDGSRPRARGWVETSFLTEAGFALLNAMGPRRTDRALPPDPRAIGILKTGFIGDVILTTGMIRRVRERYPEARLHYFCYPAAKPVLDGRPDVHRVWSPEWFPLRRVRNLLRLSTLRDMRAFAREAGRERIDLLLAPCRQETLLGSLKVALVVRMIRPRVSVGLCYGNRGNFFDIRVPDEGLLVKHASEWCEDVLRAAGIPGDCREPSVTLGEAHAAERLLKSAGLSPEDRLVILHPGGGSDASQAKWARKRWPAENFAALARDLGRIKNVRVVVTGLGSERSLFCEMKEHGMNGALDFTGATSLGEFAGLARRAALFIGNDTGATHLAAAVGTPTIALFGHTSCVDIRPLGPRVRILRHEMPCAPCVYWFDRPPCDQSYRCLRGISPEEVLSEAMRLLNSGAPEAHAPKPPATPEPAPRAGHEAGLPAASRPESPSTECPNCGRKGAQLVRKAQLAGCPRPSTYFQEQTNSFLELFGAEEVTVRVLFCRHCRMAFRSPGFDEGQLARVNSKEFAAIQRRLDVAHGGAPADRALRARLRNAEDIVRYLSQEAGVLSDAGRISRVADIGGGDGSYLGHFLEAGAQCWCVDYEREKAFDPRIRYSNCPMEDFAPDQPFEALLLIHCLEHIPSPAAFLKKASAFLRPGGFIFIEVPLELPFTVARLARVYLGAHLNYFTRVSLENCLILAGLAVRDVRTCLNGYDVPVVRAVGHPGKPGSGSQASLRRRPFLLDCLADTTFVSGVAAKSGHWIRRHRAGKKP